MRNEAFLIAGAVAALMATACDKASNITGPEVADAQPRLATGFHINEQDIFWTRDDDNPCTTPPDVVSTTGSTHIVWGSSFDDNGGLHVSISMSSRGSGVGAPSLVAYTINDQTNSSDQEGQAATETFEERLLVSAAKSELNYIRHTIFHITFNADGIPTAFVDNTFTKCAGQPIDVTI